MKTTKSVFLKKVVPEPTEPPSDPKPKPNSNPGDGTKLIKEG